MVHCSHQEQQAAMQLAIGTAVKYEVCIKHKITAFHTVP